MSCNGVFGGIPTSLAAIARTSHLRPILIHSRCEISEIAAVICRRSNSWRDHGCCGLVWDRLPFFKRFSNRSFRLTRNSPERVILCQPLGERFPTGTSHLIKLASRGGADSSSWRGPFITRLPLEAKPSICQARVHQRHSDAPRLLLVASAGNAAQDEVVYAEARKCSDASTDNRI